jgi:cytochrome P450
VIGLLRYLAGRDPGREAGQARREAPFSHAADLGSPEIARDPHRAYRRLREEGEVMFLPRHGFWIALSHQAVTSAFAQPALFSNAPYDPIDAVLLAADPPDHGAIRKAVSRPFGSEALARAEAAARDAALSLLRPRLDVVAGYGLPLSRAVTAHVIGFEEGVADQVAAREDALQDDPARIPKLIAYLDALAHRSTMYRQLRADEHDLLGEAQCRGLVRLMWLAGTVTTERVITRCVLECLLNPDLGRLLREQPELRASFVEEVLRLYPPEHLAPRQARVDAVLGGVAIPAGGILQLCTAAANRDPKRYEEADRFVVSRGERGHFAFGHGIHACVGARLSRRVIAAALSALLDASNEFRPVKPLGQIEWFHTMTALTPKRLEIAL